MTGRGQRRPTNSYMILKRPCLRLLPGGPPVQVFPLDLSISRYARRPQGAGSACTFSGYLSRRQG